MKYANRKIPVGFCPTCNRPIIYSGHGKDKNDIAIECANEDYDGKTYLCAKCKSLLIITDKTNQYQSNKTVNYGGT